MSAWPEWVKDYDDLVRRAVNQHSDQCRCDDDCYIAHVLREAAPELFEDVTGCAPDDEEFVARPALARTHNPGNRAP